MAASTVGTSLGQNPFKIQDVFTWEDLSLARGPMAEQARHSWSVESIPTGSENHFFEVRMNAFKERGKFAMEISVLLLPYDFLVYSGTSSLRAVEASDLVVPAMGYLESLLGTPLAERVIRRYGGKISEWLESVSTIYEQDEGEEWT